MDAEVLGVAPVEVVEQVPGVDVRRVLRVRVRDALEDRVHDREALLEPGPSGIGSPSQTT